MTWKSYVVHTNCAVAGPVNVTVDDPAAAPALVDGDGEVDGDEEVVLSRMSGTNGSRADIR